MEFIKTLLIACIPAICTAVITGFVTYFVARKNAAAQIKVVEEQNKHDLEKLMKQHEIDIDALNQKHEQEKEILNINHKNQLELISAQSSNDFAQSVIQPFINEIAKDPTIKSQVMSGVRKSSKKKKGKR